MPTGDFKARLGRSGHPGFEPHERRLAAIRPGENPYVTGTPLPGNSPLFYGRQRTLDALLSQLRRPEKPGCVSLVGERRIGKSSLLRQVAEALAAEEGVVTVHATAQGWDERTPARFFRHLHEALCAVLPGARAGGVEAFGPFRDFIDELSPHYRFVLILDEFEAMADHAPFDGTFFTNLRALADDGGRRFGFLVASHRPLRELCDRQSIRSSAFWNLFGIPHVLGLLEVEAVKGLMRGPMERAGVAAPEEDLPRVARYCGRQPAFLQMALAEVWQARRGGFEPDWERIEYGLREYLEALWWQRAERREEWGVLIQAADGGDAETGPVAKDLRRRGLLDGEGRPFSRYFGELIPELMPEGLGWNEALQAVREGAEGAEGVFERLLGVAEKAGRIVRVFQGREAGE